MYESHYGLAKKPFSIVPNPKILFLSKNHEKALTYLEYGLSEKAGFILLTGEIGAGKTTLVRHMINKIDARFATAVIFNTNFSSGQLFQRILSEFEIRCDTTEKEGRLARLYDFLIDRYAKARHALLIIDEAQNLTDDALEDIRMLSNLQTDDQILLQIILVGQPELRERLKLPKFRQLAQRIAVNYHISPLDKEQTRRYIEYRISKAGGEPAIITPQAIELVYRHSKGIPRTINLICDTALVYGFADNRATIDEAVIGKVIKDNICMAAGDPRPIDQTAKSGVPKSEAETEVLKRIRWLEASLRKLKQHHENSIQKVRNDILAQYQRLLRREQQRYDQLMGKYIQLLHKTQAPEQPDGFEEGFEESVESHATVKSRTKFSHLMDMADAEKDLERERSKISEFLVKKIGGNRSRV